MSVNFFDINRQNKQLEREISSALDSVVKSGRYILGDNVAILEDEVSLFCGTKYAVGVASGTDALHLALLACGIKEGDEVITSPFTFVATAEAIAYCGAKPVFVDVDRNTFNLDASKIEPLINEKTKALLPVHLYGQACQMDKIMELAKKFNLKVVEDCAQALGAELGGRQVGSFGDIGCTSFFPTKNIGCFGDGGMVTVHDPSLYEKIKILRAHGSKKTYHYDIIGYNSRLDEIHASVLRVKLANIESFLKLRRRNASIYNKHLKGLPDVILPAELPDSRHTYNQFVIRVKDRNALFEHMKAKSIGVMVYYPLSLHLQAAFASLGYKAGDFPVAESLQEEVLALPVFPELYISEVEEVCSAIRSFFER